MSNRRLKEHLYKENPHCFWCGRKTILTNISKLKGTPNPLMATVDHTVSRFNPLRWVTKKSNEIRRVLSCTECNESRSIQEQSSLPKEEIQKRSAGFSLNPRGKPHFVNTLPDVKVVLDTLKNKGIVVSELDKKCTTNT